MNLDDDDAVYGDGLDPKYIGWSARCPACQQRGEIDDINAYRVIIRHDATTWHVINGMVARRLLWERILVRAPRPRRQARAP